jgi:uncharacterized membrane protein YgcG
VVLCALCRLCILILVTALVDAQLRCVHFQHPERASLYDTDGRISRTSSATSLRSLRSTRDKVGPSGHVTPSASQSNVRADGSSSSNSSQKGGTGNGGTGNGNGNGGTGGGGYAFEGTRMAVTEMV